MFNDHNLNPDELITKYYHSLISTYPDEFSETEEIAAYIEEYYNQGALCARLRERTTNKKVVFWTSPFDSNPLEQKNGLLNFLSESKKMNVPELYNRKSNSYIVIQGIFGKETEDEIEVISYLAELFYVGISIV